MTREKIKSTVMQAIRDQLMVSDDYDLSELNTLSGIGMNSLDQAILVFELERRFRCEIVTEIAERWNTIYDVIEYFAVEKSA